MDIIAAALAAPKTHKVVTRYDNGSERTHETRSAQTAENFAVGERRKIGRSFIDRVTDKKITVVNVEVIKLN